MPIIKEKLIIRTRAFVIELCIEFESSKLILLYSYKRNETQLHKHNPNVLNKWLKMKLKGLKASKV